MNSEQNNAIINWSKLKGRPVVDIETAKRVGTLDDLVLDQQMQNIVALKFKPGLLSREQVVPISAVNVVGVDAITIHLKGVSADSPQEQSLKKSGTLSELINHGVVTQTGKYVGAVNDILLNMQSFLLKSYEISEGGIFSKKHTFEVSNDIRYGEKLITIPDSILDAARGI